MLKKASLVQIKECDEVLANVEGRLGHFRNNLGSVSDDIRSLDVKSAVLHTRLENRMKAESSLGTWLEDTTVPPELIHDVRNNRPEDPESYIPVLKELQDKLAGMQAFENYQSLAAYPLLAVRYSQCFCFQNKIKYFLDTLI